MRYAKYEMIMRKIEVYESKYDYKVASSQDIHTFAIDILRMNEFPEEHFMVIACNAAGRIIGFYEVSKGDLTSASASPREVFRTAISLNAAFLLSLHNHPSGDSSPSGSDISTTKRLQDAGKIIGIPLLDHIVIGDGEYFGFKENGMLNE